MSRNGSCASGVIINLMDVDSFKTPKITGRLKFGCSGSSGEGHSCSYLLHSVYLLYGILGQSAFTTITTTILLLLANAFISKQLGRFQELISAATDTRIHGTNEAFSNSLIIKHVALEDRFVARIHRHRYAELSSLQKRYMTWAMTASAWSGIPMIIAALSFPSDRAIGITVLLLASVAFTAISLLRLLRIPLDQFTGLFARFQEAQVPINRMELV